MLRTSIHRRPLLFLAAPAEPAGAPAPAAETPTPALTLPQKLSAAIAAKASLQARIKELEAAATTRDTENEQLQAEIERLNVAIVEKDNAHAKLTTDLATANDELAKLKGKTADELKAEAGKQAQEIVAGTGFPAGKLPKASADSTTDADVYDKWLEAKGTDKTKLWRANSDAIKREAKRRAKE
jgi:cell division septum initiation protein DivIVA